MADERVGLDCSIRVDEAGEVGDEDRFEWYDGEGVSGVGGSLGVILKRSEETKEEEDVEQR